MLKLGLVLMGAHRWARLVFTSNSQGPAVHLTPRYIHRIFRVNVWLEVGE